MSVFKTKQKELEAKIIDLENELTEVKDESAFTAKIETLDGEIETLQADAITASETIANLETEKLAFIAEKSELTELLETQDGEIATLKEDLGTAQEAVTEFDLKVSAEAAKAVASLGVDPVDEVDEQTNEGTDILAAFEKLTTSEKAQLSKADLEAVKAAIK